MLGIIFSPFRNIYSCYYPKVKKTSICHIVIGFPKLHLALISDFGLIEDFTIDGKKNAAFPKLPIIRDLFEQQNVVNSKASYDYFGVYQRNFLYYLSNNMDAYVIRHEIDKGSKIHIEIPGSKIPNSHYSGIISQKF